MHMIRLHAGLKAHVVYDHDASWQPRVMIRCGLECRVDLNAKEKGKHADLAIKAAEKASTSTLCTGLYEFVCFVETIGP